MFKSSVARKIPPLESQLDRLADLRRESSTAETRAEVAQHLANKSNLIAAKAARIAGEWQADDLIPALAAAFDRFLVKPESTDKRCAAKIEILKALCRLDYPSPALFLRGIRHVQMEPEWGGSVDTAAEVRGLSAIGLAQTGHPGALEVILPLLLDPEPQARIGAVRAVAAAGLLGGALLLRFKALQGDEPEVLGECFAALLRVEPSAALDFVAGFLGHASQSTAESAALALGESRLEPAFDRLRAALDQPRGAAIRRTLLLAIALLRREPAIDYLLDLVRSGDTRISADAADALATFSDDPKLQERLQQARAARDT